MKTLDVREEDAELELEEEDVRAIKDAVRSTYMWAQTWFHPFIPCTGWHRRQ